MKAYTDEVFVVGNIGIPYTKMAEKTTNNSITVAEISSFQLETIDRFKPDVSAILNITPDHLNRHHSMENYCRIKASITKNQTENDTCVLNYEDAWLKEFGKKAKCNVIWFSSARKLERGFYLDSDLIIYNDGNKENVICNVNELNIIGKHNYENAMAAAACAVAMNVPIEIIHKAMINFVAVEHRIEYVCTKHGVKYYNDSKGTNPDASIQAVRAMQTKTYLIGGGYDKGNEYDDWIKSFDGKIKKLILMGQTAEKIAETAKKLGFNDIVFVKSMQEAVDYCSKNASEGETVLLSPCCASWDMFKNYEERGHIFKDLARAIKE
jgi:UDP-N-acetylmuramoylalanine--D-glutamate ligase